MLFPKWLHKCANRVLRNLLDWLPVFTPLGENRALEEHCVAEGNLHTWNVEPSWQVDFLPCAGYQGNLHSASRCYATPFWVPDPGRASPPPPAFHC